LLIGKLKPQGGSKMDGESFAKELGIQEKERFE